MKSRRWPLLFVLTFASLMTCEGFALPSIKNRIAVIAHRGGASLAPENTLVAIAKAMELGADYVEVDVRQTRDGYLVCMHDSTVDRTTNGQLCQVP